MEKLDPWELELVDKYNIPSPTNDWDAWLSYPGHRWVYDKYKLSRKLNPKLLAGFKTFFDCKQVVRPRFNLDGLGREVSVVEGNPSAPVQFGYFAQSFAVGPHLSIDKDRKGRLTAYQGRKLSGSLTGFFLWHRIRILPGVGSQLRSSGKLSHALHWFQNLKVPYANMEMIGNTVIECHLRPSVQFWSRPKYSLVIHARNHNHGRVPPVMPSEIHDVFLIADEEDSRRLIVNGDNLRLCYEYALIVMGYHSSGINPLS